MQGAPPTPRPRERVHSMSLDGVRGVELVPSATATRVAWCSELRECAAIVCEQVPPRAGPLNVAAAQRILSKEVMDDLRKVHYSLGEDKVIYETDMMRSMRNGEITPEFIQCMKEDKAQADALAAELKIDHCRGVVTGVYPEYC